VIKRVKTKYHILKKLSNNYYLVNLMMNILNKYQFLDTIFIKIATQTMTSP